MNEPGGRYIDFLVPGLLGMSLMGGGLWGVGFVTVDMRIRKLLKRFLATPMKKTHFLAAIMLSRLVFIIPELLVLLGFAYLAFGVRIVGSPLAVLALILLGTFTFAGIGLLVASRARTMEAVSGLMNLVMLPMWILSGIFFSSRRFPQAVQPLIHALPLTPLNDALRGHAGRGVAGGTHAADRDSCRVGRGHVRAGAVVVSLELIRQPFCPSRAAMVAHNPRTLRARGCRSQRKNRAACHTSCNI